MCRNYQASTTGNMQHTRAPKEHEMYVVGAAWVVYGSGAHDVTSWSSDWQPAITTTSKFGMW